MYFLDKLSGTRPAPGELAIFWLGNAGFILKAHSGETLVIDPYLTDCVERLSGYKRLMMPLLEPEELQADVYLCTHNHDDHFDVDLAPVALGGNPGMKLVCPQSVTAMCGDLGIASAQVVTVREGDSLSLAGFQITVVYADHGELEPDALGFVVEHEGIVIYFTGDTAYRPGEMAPAFRMKPDIVVLPINGEFGNLDNTEAALTARDSGASIVIPSHFWTLAVHGSNPIGFPKRMAQIAPNCRTAFLCQGEVMTVSRTSLGK